MNKEDKERQEKEVQQLNENASQKAMVGVILYLAHKANMPVSWMFCDCTPPCGNVIVDMVIDDRPIAIAVSPKGKAWPVHAAGLVKSAKKPYKGLFDHDS